MAGGGGGALVGFFNQLLSNLVVAGKADRVFEPLGQNNLEAALAVDLNLAEELNHVLRTAQRQSGKDENEGLNESSGLRRGQSVSNRLQELWQEWAETLLSGLLHQLGGQASHLRSSIVFDGRAKQSINDVEADLQTGSAVGVVPVKDLLVVVHQNPLDCLGSRSQNVALTGLHEQAVELGQHSADKAIRERLRAVLCQND